MIFLNPLQQVRIVYNRMRYNGAVSGFVNTAKHAECEYNWISNQNFGGISPASAREAGCTESDRV